MVVGKMYHRIWVQRSHRDIDIVTSNQIALENSGKICHICIVWQCSSSIQRKSRQIYQEVFGLLTPLALLLALGGVPSINSGIPTPTLTSSQLQTKVNPKGTNPSVTVISQAISQAPTDRAIATKQVAKILPSDTIGVVFLNFNDRAWADLRQFNPFSRKALKPLQSLGLVLALPEGTNFAKDVLPWLGDRITIAGLSLQPDVPVSFVIVLPVKDRGALDAFITGLQKKHSRVAKTQTYKGISLVSWERAKTAKPEEEKEEENFDFDLPFPFSDRGIDINIERRH